MSFPDEVYSYFKITDKELPIKYTQECRDNYVKFELCKIKSQHCKIESENLESCKDRN